jgi:hypothetical protein
MNIADGTNDDYSDNDGTDGWGALMALMMAGVH